jgi:hypothetical protein
MRSTLLPDSLLTEHWISLFDSIDEVWADSIDAKARALYKIRYALSPTSTGVSSLSTHDTLDRETLIQKIRALGLAITTSIAVSTASLYRISFSLGMFYRYKSSMMYIEAFLKYVFNCNLSIRKLYTADYLTFVERPAFSSLHYNGGTLYPTSQYIIYVVEPSLVEVDSASLLSTLQKLMPASAVINRVVLTTILP